MWTVTGILLLTFSSCSLLLSPLSDACFSANAFRQKLHHSSLAIRHSDGSISGFVGYADGQMKLPPKWLPATSNVVTFSKKSALKKPRVSAGLFSYFLITEPGPVGVNVDPLGEALGPTPDGL
jgi:hypothetical protein